MPLPLPRLLSLSEAAKYVATRCNVTCDEAKISLDRAFREYSLAAFCDGDRFERIEGLEAAEIEWQDSHVMRRIHSHYYRWRNVRVFRKHLDDWMGLADESHLSEIGTQARDNSKPMAHSGPIYRTGLPGKTTSWHLIEAECRRRYAAGERHPGKTGESRAEWSRVLIAWLCEAHPAAPAPKPKTLTNTLGGFLRELAAQRPES